MEGGAEGRSRTDTPVKGQRFLSSLREARTRSPLSAQVRYARVNDQAPTRLWSHKAIKEP